MNWKNVPREGSPLIAPQSKFSQKRQPGRDEHFSNKYFKQGRVVYSSTRGTTLRSVTERSKLPPYCGWFLLRVSCCSSEGT